MDFEVETVPGANFRWPNRWADTGGCGPVPTGPEGLIQVISFLAANAEAERFLPKTAKYTRTSEQVIVVNTPSRSPHAGRPVHR
jgi:hypothetical protein